MSEIDSNLDNEDFGREVVKLTLIFSGWIY